MDKTDKLLINIIGLCIGIMMLLVFSLEPKNTQGKWIGRQEAVLMFQK